MPLKRSGVLILLSGLSEKERILNGALGKVKDTLEVTSEEYILSLTDDIKREADAFQSVSLALEQAHEQVGNRQKNRR